MERRELQEIEDLEACPTWLRDAMTGYLQVVIDQARPYDVAAPILDRLLGESQGRSILDLASGGGGPWPALRDHLAEHPEPIGVTLSDLAPSREAARRFSDLSGFDYRMEPVSVLDPIEEGHDVWTMFTGLHHFGPDEVKELMSQAQRRRVRFAAFEATHRSGRGVLITLFIPLLVLLLMPRVRPRRLLPLLLTYLPPLVPLAIWWDGFASTLRTHTVDELRALADEVEVDGYEWVAEDLVVPGAPIPVLSLVGRPIE